MHKKVENFAWAFQTDGWTQFLLFGERFKMKFYTFFSEAFTTVSVHAFFRSEAANS